jgi:hypothetical protein
MPMMALIAGHQVMKAMNQTANHSPISLCITNTPLWFLSFSRNHAALRSALSDPFLLLHNQAAAVVAKTRGSYREAVHRLKILLDFYARALPAAPLRQTARNHIAAITDTTQRTLD